MSDPAAQAGPDQSSGNLQMIWAVALQLGDFFLARMTDTERCLVNNAIGVDHNVGLVECCDARFEIKRDEGRINLQKVQAPGKHRGQIRMWSFPGGDQYIRMIHTPCSW